MSTEAAKIYLNQLDESVKFLAQRCGKAPDVIVILGSGLGGLVDDLENPTLLNFNEIPHFPISTVAGHAGRLAVGMIGSVKVALLEGRVHLYEGYSGPTVAFSTRALGRWGAKTLIVTNSAGGMSAHLKVGDLMLLTNHIGLFSDDPTEGVYHSELGPLFYDVFQPYDSELNHMARRSAAKLGIDLKEGVYCFYRQCSYETQAEIRFMANMGADAVGKSTVVEVLAARQMGLKVMGISCISSAMAVSNFATPLTHEEVLEAGKQASNKFHGFLKEVLKSL